MKIVIHLLQATSSRKLIPDVKSLITTPSSASEEMDIANTLFGGGQISHRYNYVEEADWRCSNNIEIIPGNPS